MSAALIALSAATFTLGIAAGNGPRLITAARDAATDWSHAAPRPSPHLGGTPIMSTDTTPGHDPDPDRPPPARTPATVTTTPTCCSCPARDGGPAPDGGNAGRGGQPPRPGPC